MPRQARLDAPGILQHVMIRGIDKQRVVNDEKDRHNFISRMGELALETGTRMYAWALMSNHIHILLRTGSMGLPKYMRRLLTGYAITYNHRHARHGYLFQDRYKSIVCDEDAYFLELVRYIHLNPLRAKLVKDVAELDRYPWCGHSVVMGYNKYPWQDTEYILSWFNKKKRNALKAYRQYINEGVSQGRRPELVGGGLNRHLRESAGRLTSGPSGGGSYSDRRILGDEEFVEKILRGPVHGGRHLPPLIRIRGKVKSIIEEQCRGAGIHIEELQMGSRRHSIAKVRSDIAWQLASDLGLPLAEIGRQLGVSTSGISKILERRKRSGQN